MVDYGALTMIVAELSAMILTCYVIVLLVLRVTPYYRIKACPVCSGKLSRKKRASGDKWATILSFGLLPLKRYRCYACYWEGQAFEIGRGEREVSVQDSDNRSA